MATQIQSRSLNLNKKFVRCAMCKSRATQNHFVEDAGGILCVCDYCNFVLELKDRIAELEAELAQYKAEGNQMYSQMSVGECPECGDELYLFRTKARKKVVKCVNDD